MNNIVNPYRLETVDYSKSGSNDNFVGTTCTGYNVQTYISTTK